MMATSLPTDERERRQTAMKSLRQDASYAVHSFARAPGFLAVVVLTLGFALAEHANVQRRARGRSSSYSGNPNQKQRDGIEFVSPATFRDWKNHNRVFSHLAAFIHTTFTLTGADQPERVAGELVSSGFLDVLRVQPVLGSGFSPEDEARIPYTPVPLSQRLW